MSDALNAPADRVAGFFGRLHPVTRIVAAAAIVSLFGDIVQLIGVISALQQGSALAPLSQSISTFLNSLGYSIGFIGGAASVEYLFRIWREVKAIRERGQG